MYDFPNRILYGTQYTKNIKAELTYLKQQDIGKAEDEVSGRSPESWPLKALVNL